MSFNLGIDVGDDRVCAAVERGGTMRMVAFGTVRSAPVAVHVGRDGTITAGHDAVAAAALDPAGAVPDLLARLDDPKSVVVNGYAITGEALVAHLLAHVLDAARAQTDGEPLGEVVLAHPEGWRPERRAALLAAAAQAGAASADAQPASRTVVRAPESARHLPEQAPALGAAVLAVQRARGAAAAPTTSPSAGAVTGPEPEVPPPPRPARPAGRPVRPAPPLPTESPTSVFDATDPSSSRDTVLGAGAGGAFWGIPGGAIAGGGSGGSGGPGPRPVGGDDGGPSRVPFLVVGGVLVVLLVVLVIVLATRGDDTPDASATGATGPSASTSTTTTSTTTTSTSVPASTTSSSTTTAPPTTTTKPSATTSTTTTITAPSRIGPVALADNGLVLQFGSTSSFTLRFGDDADGTLSRLGALIGSPASDTGWQRVELCVGDGTRRVVFGDLELVFTKNASGAPSGSRTFQQWFVDTPGKRPDGLVTLDRIGIGSTIADLKKVYGDALKVVQPIAGDPSGLFTTSSSSSFIDGITSGTSDKSFVKQMWAGTACQRVAD